MCLISAGYLAQEQQELAEIWQRQRAGAQVIPVLVKPALLEGTLFEALQPLPASGMPISLWPNHDQAVLDVVKGVLRAIPMPVVAEPAAMPAAPMPTGDGQAAHRPSATPPVGVIYHTEKRMPPPTPADFPTPVSIPTGRRFEPVEDMLESLPQRFLKMTSQNLRLKARELLDLLKTDADFDKFVIDHFFETKKRFSAGMERLQKTNLLLELEDPGALITCLQNKSKPYEDAKASPCHWRDNTSKIWIGKWSDVSGFEYSFKLTLRREGSRVGGAFDWTLTAAPRGSRLTRRIGEHSTERIKGSIEIETGLLALEGIDISNISINTVDKYALQMNTEGYLAGNSRGDDGKWQTTLTGRLVEVQGPLTG